MPGDAPPEGKPNRITAARMFAASMVLALVISVPAITVSLIMFYLIKAEWPVTMVFSLVTLFVAMGFGYKLSKKLAKVQGTDDGGASK